MPQPLPPIVDRMIGAGMLQWAFTTSIKSVRRFVTRLGAWLGGIAAGPVVPQPVALITINQSAIRDVGGVTIGDVSDFYGAVRGGMLAGQAFRVGGEVAALPYVPLVSIGAGPLYPVGQWQADQWFRVTGSVDSDSGEPVFRTLIIPGNFRDYGELRDAFEEELRSRGDFGKMYDPFLLPTGELRTGVVANVDVKLRRAGT